MLMMTPEFAEAELALTNYGVDLYWEEREYNRHANTMRKAKEKLPGTSPGVRQGLEANIANRKLWMAGHLANSVLRCFAAHGETVPRAVRKTGH